jgi:hypothetical protein
MVHALISGDRRAPQVGMIAEPRRRGVRRRPRDLGRRQHRPLTRLHGIEHLRPDDRAQAQRA